MGTSCSLGVRRSRLVPGNAWLGLGGSAHGARGYRGAMSEQNTHGNRVVWFDLPVKDLNRAAAFYGAVLKIKVDRESGGGMEFAVLEHGPGNGGCLVVKPEDVPLEADIHKGPLLYLGVEGRIDEATAMVTELGGRVLTPVHSVGPHGFRSIVLDSEGNRVALHSEQRPSEAS